MNHFSTTKKFFNDREYFKSLVMLAIPIAAQNLISSSLNLIAVILIGQLGEVAVASVGLGNQIFFLLNLIVFGVISGSAIFIAQFWGKGDIHNIRRVVGLTIKLALIVALFFWTIATFFPQSALRLYSEDPAVIQLGSRYLQMVCWTYGFYALTSAFSAALRSTGNVKLPLVISTSALGLDILLAYVFIFGIKAIGLPALGVEGVALAGIVARVLECSAIIFFVYKDKNNPVAASFKEITTIDFKFIVSVMKPILPVIANETLWSLGITTYNSIYGHIGTNAVAAMNIMGTIEQMAFVIFLGIGTSTAIMVGHQIGLGNKEKAYVYGGRSLVIQMLGAMVMGAIIYFVAGNLFRFYKVDPEVIDNARKILLILSIGLWIKASNHTIIIGMLRAGGDTKFSLLLDGLVIWFVGVPATAAGAFLFDLPIYFVYALTYTEEIMKMIFGVRRYFSKKWVNDVTTQVVDISVP